MRSLADRFPDGITYDIPLDTSLFVSQSIREVEFTLFIAAALVLLVVFIFLESWQATLIPMLACRCRLSAPSRCFWRSASPSTR